MTQFKWILALIALGLLSLVSLSPFLSDQMPLTDDGNLHVYRSIVLDDAIRHDGSLYPRYVSGLAYGYGASLFNYFPPTSYYPTVIFHAIGLEWVSAWKATMVLYVLLAVLGTFLWARQWVDEIGAFIAAAAYIYAPYTLFDTITRGSSNEFAGMALLPFALWGFTRLARFGRRSDYLIAVFSYALFIMAHNVMTLYGSLLLILYCGFLWLTSKRPSRVLLQLGSAGIFAVLMTAFFWLPALSETDFVKINGVLDHLDFVDVTNTLRNLGAVFALPHTADPSQLQAEVPISFHCLLIILGIAGFFLPQPLQRDNNRNLPILGLHLLLFAVLGIVVYSQLMISADLWQSVRLLQYSQFAWRPMSIGSLVLALLAGIGGSYALRLLRSPVMKFSGLGVVLALIILYSIPWLYRPEISLQAETLADAQRYELTSRQPVLSSYGEYLPAQTEQSALNPLRFQDEASRLAENDAYEILSLDEKSRRLSAELDLREEHTIVLDWLYVQGWRASVDGSRVDVMPSGEAGFVSLDVPEGTHKIEVWYAQTEMQRNATILSVVALIAVIGIVVRYPISLNHSPNSERDLNAAQNSLSLVVILVVGIVGVLLFALKVQVIDRVESPFQNARFQDGILEDVEIPLAVNFNDEIRLLGAEIDEHVISGERTSLHLYWTLAGEPISADYSTIVQLVNSEGIVIAEARNFYPGGLATSNWLPDYYIEDRVVLEIPEYTPPLDFKVVLGLFESDNGQRLDVMNEIGNPIGIDAEIGMISIERPRTAPDPIDLPRAIIRAAGFDLLSIEGLPDTAQVGDEIVMSWVWNAFIPGNEFSPQLLWDNAGGVTISPIITDFPISEWQSRDVWRGYHRFYVPATLPEGAYDLFVQISSQQAEISHTMFITVPERHFEMPEIDNPLNINWQNGIHLLGYKQVDSTLTLYWQTQAVMDESLRLFVQVFNAEGQILAIDDGYPVNGERPTTSWVTEEIITTEHELGALPDEYSLLIGWYHSLKGQRITLLDSDEDAFSLPLPSQEAQED